MSISELGGLIDTAIKNRRDLIEKLHAEKTDAYRLFHGVNEGRPGLTIDRYGSQVLVQSFHEPFDMEEIPVIREHIGKQLGFEPTMVFRDRSPESKKEGKSPVFGDEIADDQLQICQEMGVKYVVKGMHKGQDPLLFLDLRSARRFILDVCKDKSVLNLFSYTCGVGICAAVAGAKEVWNVDFSKSWLEFGRQNAELNDVSDETIQFIQSDYFPAIRQLAGMQIQGRGRKKPYKKMKPRQFDVVLLDPPRWAKSVFGTVDLIRDYQSVFKPALLTVADGGKLICTNHVPKVDLNEWLELLKRCAEKAERPIQSIQLIEPESDFPSSDGKHPLKIAVIEV